MPLTPLQIYFGWRGRIARGTWWLYGVAAPFGLWIMSSMLLQIAGLKAEAAQGLASLGLTWPILATSAKRWHDIDRTGWWALVLPLPVVGTVVAVVCNGLLKGTAGENRYGPAPE